MKRPVSLALACAGLVLASACDLGSELSGVAVPQLVPLTLAPSFAVDPTEEELAALDLLVVKLGDAGDGNIVQSDSLSSDAEWLVNFSVPVSESAADSFRVSAELLTADGVVEWSGLTEPFTVDPSRGFQTQVTVTLELVLYRGPMANLGLDSLSLSQGSLRLVQGATSTLEWDVAGDLTGTVIYFASTDTSVATVDASGVVTATGLGATEIFVFAGAVGDSLPVEVAAPQLPTQSDLDELIDPALEYVTSDLFISTFHDPVGGESVRSRFSTLRGRLQAGDAPGAVDAFEGAKEIWRTYGLGTPLRELDDPQLGVLELTLLRVATGLTTAFP